jgi:hypothetical protein
MSHMCVLSRSTPTVWLGNGGAESAASCYQLSPEVPWPIVISCSKPGHALALRKSLAYGQGFAVPHAQELSGQQCLGY